MTPFYYSINGKIVCKKGISSEEKGRIWKDLRSEGISCWCENRDGQYTLHIEARKKDGGQFPELDTDYYCSLVENGEIIYVGLEYQPGAYVFNRKSGMWETRETKLFYGTSNEFKMMKEALEEYKGKGNGDGILEEWIGELS